MGLAASPGLLRRRVASALSVLLAAVLALVVVPANAAGAQPSPAGPVFTGPGATSGSGPVGVAHPVAVGGNYQPLAMSCRGERRVLWYAPGDATDALWRQVSTPTGGTASYSSASLGVGGRFRPVTGDFDGDGCEDVFWVATDTATASRLWYFAADGTYQSTSVSPAVPVGMTAIVGDFDGDTRDDVFWYGAGPARERIWSGETARGRFTERSAPQVGGTYTPVLALDSSSILWFQAGPGEDYLWRGIRAGATAPAASWRTTVGGLYAARNVGGTALLFAPGTGTDYLITGVSAPSSTGLVTLGTVAAAIDESYVIGDSTARAGFAVFHLPKEGVDYLVSPRAAASSTIPWGWQFAMLDSINAERAAAGRGPVALCPSLSRAAQAHTDDQAWMARMSHTGSDGSILSTRVERWGYVRWATLGENVAYWYRSVGEVQAAWMRSPGHRTNLLAPEFTHVGLGRTQRAGDGTWYWTQNFGRSGTC
jgi:hypothetical protein